MLKKFLKKFKIFTVKEYNDFVMLFPVACTFVFLSFTAYKTATCSPMETFTNIMDNVFPKDIFSGIDNANTDNIQPFEQNKEIINNQEKSLDVQRKFQQEVIEDNQINQKQMLEDCTGDENKTFAKRVIKGLVIAGAVAAALYLVYHFYTKGGDDSAMRALSDLTWLEGTEFAPSAPTDPSLEIEAPETDSGVFESKINDNGLNNTPTPQPRGGRSFDDVD